MKSQKFLPAKASDREPVGATTYLPFLPQNPPLQLHSAKYISVREDQNTLRNFVCASIPRSNPHRRSIGKPQRKHPHDQQPRIFQTAINNHHAEELEISSPLQYHGVLRLIESPPPNTHDPPQGSEKTTRLAWQYSIDVELRRLTSHS